MRIILKNSFFSVVCFLTVLFFGMSCQRENGPVEQEPGSPVTLESGEAALSFCVSTPVVGDNTKSVITDTYFETGIRSILILVLGEDGSWKSNPTADDETNLLSMTVSGAGTIAFRWKTSCEGYFNFKGMLLRQDGLSFFVDSEEAAFTNGVMSGWGQCIYTSWSLMAEQHGFIAVFPDAAKRMWTWI